MNQIIIKYKKEESLLSEILDKRLLILKNGMEIKRIAIDDKCHKYLDSLLNTNPFNDERTDTKIDKLLGHPLEHNAPEGLIYIFYK